jgi:peptide/nickel transport system substrate-binding protein
MKRAAAGAIVFALIFAVFSGCAGKGRGVRFNIALDADIPSLDPGQSYSYESVQVTNQLTEGLVAFNGEGELVPVLAREWRQADDLTYVYEVRPDVTFSDGSPMTMEDVLFSLERTRNGEDGTYYADYFNEVERFRVDGWRLTVTLSRPSMVFKYNMATNAGRIISKAYYLAHRENFGTAEGGVLATGPFAFKSWKAGEEIVLERNENYWDKAALAANPVGEAVFIIIPDDTTRLAAVQAGSIDFTMLIAADLMGSLADNPAVNITVIDSYGSVSLSLNTARPPFNDRNVRKAVSRAIDPRRLNQEIFKGGEKEGRTLIFGPSLYGDDGAKWEAYLASSPGYDYNPEAARNHLAQSAYPEGFDCEFLVDQGILNHARARFIQESLAPIGITVDLHSVDNTEIDAYLLGQVLDPEGARDYDLCIIEMVSDYPDITGIAYGLLDSSQARSGYNTAGYSNPTVDALIKDQAAETDPERRFEVQKRLMDIVVDDAPYIPLQYMTLQCATNARFAGELFTPDWAWYMPLQNVTLARRNR